MSAARHYAHAESIARHDLETYCKRRFDLGQGWYDTNNIAGPHTRIVDIAVDYLETRKRIERHPKHRLVIRITERTS